MAEIHEIWQVAMVELAEADADYLSPAHIEQLTIMYQKIGKQASQHTELRDDVKNLLQTYRAALKLCIQFWSLQNQRSLDATAFMLEVAPPPTV